MKSASMNIRMSPIRRRGFTMLEILIALIIIGVLAAMAIPQVSGSAGASRQVNLKQTANDIASGLEADYLLNKGYPSTAGSFAAAHAELPRIKVSGVEWGVFSTTPDRSGAIVQVRPLTNAADSCSLGVGSLSSAGSVCTL
jgi:prepilin-type N-terminal cleavage/methylation domain-containing protein